MEPEQKQPLVFIPALGTLGDVYPYMALATKLAKQGVRVRLGTHIRHKQIASRPEYEWVEMGGDLEHTLATTPEGQQMQKNPSVFNFGLIKKVFYPLMTHWFEDIAKYSADADLIILGIVSLLAGLSSLELHPNLKLVCIFLYPTTPTSEYTPPVLSGKSTSWFGWVNSLKWTMSDKGAWSLWSDELNKHRKNHNLPPIKESLRHFWATLRNPHPLCLTAYSSELVARPKDWTDHDDVIPPMFPDADQSDYKPSKELESFLDSSKPKPIFIGMGSMMHSMLHKHEQVHFVKEWVAGLKHANVRAVISLSGMDDDDKSTFKSDNDVHFIESFIPHHWLFPKIAAVVHHGGAGTTHTGLLYGLPTLICPFGADQPFNGDRIFIKKLGPEPIPIREITAHKFASAVKKLIHEPDYATNAQRVSQVLRSQDGVATAANVVLDTLAGKNPRAPVAIVQKQ